MIEELKAIVGTNEKISQVAKQVDDAFKTVNTRIIENNDNTENRDNINKTLYIFFFLCFFL